MNIDNNEQKYTFLIEHLSTPIYQRISQGFKNALEKQGHQVIYFDPSEYLNQDDALKKLLKLSENQNIDYCLILGNHGCFKSYCKFLEQYVFELFNFNLIFIHHDSIGYNFFVAENAFASYFEAICRVNSRSWHFCIEQEDIIDLKLLGIQRVAHIFHASEFTKMATHNQYNYNISFVGHVLPGFEAIYKSKSNLAYLPAFHHVSAGFWNRLINLDLKLKQSAHNQYRCINNITAFQNKFEYIYLATLLNPSFRGEIINRLKASQIDIVGGDPGYMSEIMEKRCIQKSGVIYHPPTQDYTEAQSIYASSKINLNITSLQFDDAVVNRVIDVGAAGGFILTDWKSDLPRVTSVHEQIAYKTIEELNDKIDYYLSHEKERLEIADQLHQDIITNNSYEHIVNYMLSKVSQITNEPTDNLRLDLGCGPRKTAGFVGVDIHDWEGVDVVADLTRRFPFPDSSVDEIKAYDVVEHLPDRIHTMNEIWRICKPEAIVDILVPSTDGRGAFQDPTHVSFWNINSFKYYSVEFPEYLDLCKSYGFQGAYKIISLSQQESGDGVVHVRAILQVIKDNNKNQEYLDDLSNKLNQRKINLLISIDWTQPEQAIIEFLKDVLTSISNSTYREDITLLIDTSNFPKDYEISPEEIISEIALTLMLEENIDVLNEGVEVAILPPMSQIQWQSIASKICGRVQWDYENADTIVSLKMNNLGIYDLKSLNSKQVVQVDDNTWTLEDCK